MSKTTLYRLLAGTLTPSEELGERIYQLTLETLGEEETLAAATGKYVDFRRGKGSQNWRVT